MSVNEAGSSHGLRQYPIDHNLEARLRKTLELEARMIGRAYLNAAALVESELALQQSNNPFVLVHYDTIEAFADHMVSMFNAIAGKLGIDADELANVNRDNRTVQAEETAEGTETL